MHVTGPIGFEIPHAEVEAPGGDGPLVLVAPSTAQDPDARLVRTALEALAGEPVRVLATLNRRGATLEPPAVPANAKVVDWLGYSQAMRGADVVVCHGGHGTVARALGAGVPLVCCPAAGDMAENGARVAWSRTGVMLPGRLLGPRSLRLAVLRVLGEPSFRARAGEIAAWSREHNGAALAAELVEELGRTGARVA